MQTEEIDAKLVAAIKDAKFKNILAKQNQFFLN